MQKSVEHANSKKVQEAKENSSKTPNNTQHADQTVKNDNSSSRSSSGQSSLQGSNDDTGITQNNGSNISKSDGSETGYAGKENASSDSGSIGNRTADNVGIKNSGGANTTGNKAGGSTGKNITTSGMSGKESNSGKSLNNNSLNGNTAGSKAGSGAGHAGKSSLMKTSKAAVSASKGSATKGFFSGFFSSVNKTLASFFAKAVATSKMSIAVAAVAGGIGISAVGLAGMNMKYNPGVEQENVSMNAQEARITLLSASSEGGGNPLRIEGNGIGPGIGAFQFTTSIAGVTDYLVSTGNAIYNPLKKFAGQSNAALYKNQEHWSAWCSVVDAPVSAGTTAGNGYISMMNLNKARQFINDQTTYALSQYLYADNLSPEANNGYDIRNASDVVKGVVYSFNILYGTGTGRGKIVSGLYAGMSDVEFINHAYDTMLSVSDSIYHARWREEKELALQMAQQGDSFNPFIKVGKVDWTWRDDGTVSSGSSTGGTSSDASSSFDTSKIVFVGDSRTEGMRAAVSSNAKWVCKTGEGYNWMVNTAFPQVDDMISSGYKVVILLGVNDIGNVDSYVSAVNKKAAEWKKRGVSTYFVSVNGVVDSLSSYVKNSQIQSFNNRLSSKLSGVSYIDTNASLSINTSNTDSAGIHYTNSVYNKIYNIILSNLKGSAGSGTVSSGVSDVAAQDVIEHATSYCERVADDNRFGYHTGTEHRWPWNSDQWGYSCSSLIISAYKDAGVDVYAAGATMTYNMEEAFVACGFENVIDQVNIKTGEGLERGDVLLYPYIHTEIYLGNGIMLGARGNSDGVKGDSSGSEIARSGYIYEGREGGHSTPFHWTVVLRYKGGLEKDDDTYNYLHVDWSYFSWEDWDWKQAVYVLPNGWQNDIVAEEEESSNEQAALNAKRLYQQATAHSWKYCRCYASGGGSHRGGYCPAAGAFSFDCSWTVWAAYNGGSYDGVTLKADTYDDGSSKMPMSQTGNMLAWMVQTNPDKLMTNIVPFGGMVPLNQIDSSKLKPGDIILYYGADPTAVTYNGTTVTTSHANIYVGDGMVVDGGTTPMRMYNVNSNNRSVVAVYRP